MSESCPPPAIDPDDPTTWPDSARRLWQARQSGEQPPGELERRLLRELAASGPIPFAEFMRRCLYEEDGGYYRSEHDPLGEEGDFVTSADLHPAFGLLLGRWVWRAWQDLGRPEPLVLVEAGPGTGALAAGVLTHLEQSEAGPEIVDYRLVEAAPAWRQRQQTRLAPWLDRCSWHASLTKAAPDSGVGVFLANELLDAFPCHRVIWDGAELREIWVDAVDGELREESGPLSDPALEQYLPSLGLQPREGDVMAISLAMLPWLQELRRLFRRGTALLLDYGGEAEELYGDPDQPADVRACYQHTDSTNLLARPGRQDLTFDVDFTLLRGVAASLGFEPVDHGTQQEFLTELGIQEFLQPGDAAVDRKSLLDLLDPHLLGAVLALELRWPAAAKLS